MRKTRDERVDEAQEESNLTQESIFTIQMQGRFCALDIDVNPDNRYDNLMKKRDSFKIAKLVYLQKYWDQTREYHPAPHG